MKKKIYLTKEDKKLIEADVEQIELGRTLMEHGGKLTRIANNNLWRTVKDKWPNASNIDHPHKKKWSITVDD